MELLINKKLKNSMNLKNGGINQGYKKDYMLIIKREFNLLKKIGMRIIKYQMIFYF